MKVNVEHFAAQRVVLNILNQSQSGLGITRNLEVHKNDLGVSRINQIDERIGIDLNILGGNGLAVNIGRNESGRAERLGSLAPCLGARGHFQLQ
jgi:hypothetical protein